MVLKGTHTYTGVIRGVRVLVCNMGRSVRAVG